MAKNQNIWYTLFQNIRSAMLNMAMRTFTCAVTIKFWFLSQLSVYLSASYYSSYSIYILLSVISRSVYRWTTEQSWFYSRQKHDTLLRNVQAVPCSHAASYSVSAESPFLGAKRVEREADHTDPSTVALAIESPPIRLHGAQGNSPLPLPLKAAVLEAGYRCLKFDWFLSDSVQSAGRNTIGVYLVV